MTEISFAELDEQGTELLPERAVLSTISSPGASYTQSSHETWYQAGPNGASFGESSSFTHSEAGYGGLLGGLL